MNVLLRVADTCEAGAWRAEVSVVQQGAEAEVAVANAGVDTLEKMIKESRGNKLSAGVCTSEDTGVGVHSSWRSVLRLGG